MSARLPARMSNPARAFAAGLRAQLVRQTTYAAWRTEQQLRAAPPEVAAAYEAGKQADLAGSMPAPGVLIAAVVRQMAGTCGALDGTITGPDAGAGADQAAS